jgi:hypothetical protein
MIWKERNHRIFLGGTALGRAYVRASSDPYRCFILKLSCHSVNIFVGLRELRNNLHRGVVASFQLGLVGWCYFSWAYQIHICSVSSFFFAMLNSMSTVACHRLVAILDLPLAPPHRQRTKRREL